MYISFSESCPIGFCFFLRWRFVHKMSSKDFLYRVISMFLNSIGFESYISAEVMGQGIFVFLRHAKRKVIFRTRFWEW